MKRLGMLLGLFIVPMAISSSAEAGSYSFVIGGRHIHIEAPRNCRSSSCVSVSSSGAFERKRDSSDDAVTAPVAAPASPPAPVAAPAPACAPAPAPVKPLAPIIAAAPPPPPPAAPVLASTAAQDVVLPPLPKLEPPKIELPKTSSLEPPPSAKPDITPVLQRTEDDPVDAPLGQWETEGGKGTVRIERCGIALCGYALTEAASDKGESVLVNMKPKSASVWSGSVYSRDTGNTYYATMTLKSQNRLHVEACALGRFFCSGNDWTRIEEPRGKLLTTQRQGSGARS
ncbi:DUF2147 domain-containing protein [Bradyrhizobium manausense]|uniref:DUF2147 domain-containing protein n=1 Tax=Bradyrhizobium TaxID=374 RepID=UPI001BACBA11|nr:MULTISPECIES: DUF2147 domain-containing protein [Bradyrhizobium]MBR0825932.1 DUF2147 domain-containing protein [Bradyrhizobium manausense]UVO31133.1 DUF2147 domain-containing protein [Bradyrhizobium arachidis]